MAKIRLFSIYMLLIFLIIAVPSCSPGKQNPYYQKKKSASKVSSTQLGRNKYYYSSGYQKKLNKNYKK